MNVNLARFVGKTEWDFFGDFSNPVSLSLRERKDEMEDMMMGAN